MKTLLRFLYKAYLRYKRQDLEEALWEHVSRPDYPYERSSEELLGKIEKVDRQIERL